MKTSGIVDRGEDTIRNFEKVEQEGALTPFWQRRCRAAAAGAVLKPSGGNCAVLPKIKL